MQLHSAEEAKQKYEKLPAEIKQFLYSPEMTFSIQQIGQKHKLHLDQIDFLNSETGQVLLGFVGTKDFAAELAEGLGIDRMQSDAIAQDISDQVFVKIRDAMKKASVEPKSPTPVAATPSAPIQPKILELHPADMMLAQKTVSIAPAAPVLPIAPKPAAPTPPPTSPIPPATPPVAPKPYTADPYREPAE